MLIFLITRISFQWINTLFVYQTYSFLKIEILFAINQGHRIVGTHSFVTYPDEAKAIPDAVSYTHLTLPTNREV